MYNQWCTIESDPGVFTQLVKNIGAPRVQVEEIYSMDDDELITKIQPSIYGFIFLFKWTKNLEKRQALTIYDKQLFFARQVISNACATQAILSVVLNAPIQIEGNLKQFYEFTKDLSSQDRGLALSNSEAIRLIHNSFSRPQPFIFKQQKKPKKQMDLYHFVSYIPYKGHLYELDGLQPGPILIGKFDKNDQWIQLARKQIRNRIEKYNEKQIRFNLLVVCEDLKKKAEVEIISLRKQRAKIYKKMKELGQNINQQQLAEYNEIQSYNESDIDTLNLKQSQLTLQMEEKQQFCQQQDEKAKHRKSENIRRKHNYVPMIIQILKTLAKKNKLGPLIEDALKKP